MFVKTINHRIHSFTIHSMTSETSGSRGGRYCEDSEEVHCSNSITRLVTTCQLFSLSYPGNISHPFVKQCYMARVLHNIILFDSAKSEVIIIRSSPFAHHHSVKGWTSNIGLVQCWKSHFSASHKLVATSTT